MVDPRLRSPRCTDWRASLERWPGARVLGIDSSPEMLEKAAAAAEPPRLEFELGDLRTWHGAGADVVLSNATLQWVPGHLALLAPWVSRLAPGGCLAVGVPANFSEPTHTLLRQLAEEQRWRAPLAHVQAMLAVHSPSEYHRALAPTGADLDIWETTYHHVLHGPDPVLEWVRGSALRPYLDALGPDDGAAFEAAYAEGLRRAYPAGDGGETVLPFHRLFVVATVRVSG